MTSEVSTEMACRIRYRYGDLLNKVLRLAKTADLHQREDLERKMQVVRECIARGTHDLKMDIQNVVSRSLSLQKGLNRDLQLLLDALYLYHDRMGIPRAEVGEMKVTDTDPVIEEWVNIEKDHPVNLGVLHVDIQTKDGAVLPVTTMANGNFWWQLAGNPVRVENVQAWRPRKEPAK